jgi:hypothetical protein
MCKEPKLLRMQPRPHLLGSTTIVNRRVILLISAPISISALICTALAANLALNCNANSTPTTARQNYALERVNHMVIDDAQEAPYVVLSMFLINANIALVLFDYGVSHSFISDAYFEKHNLLISTLKTRMIVTSPQWDMPVRLVCHKKNFKIRRR